MNLIKKIYTQLQKLILFIRCITSVNFLKYLICINKNKCSNKNNRIFIFDNFENFPNTFFRSIYLNFFSKILNTNLFYINYKFNPIYKLIYTLLSSKQLNINLTKEQTNEQKVLLEKFFKENKSKLDVLNFQIDGINFGMDIYETYLIKFYQPTIHDVSKKNIMFKELVKNSIKTFIFWRDFIKENKHRIDGVLLSHRNYVDTNILNRISIKNDLRVFTLSGEGHSIQRWKNLDLNFFRHYNEIFENLSIEEKAKAIEWSKQRLKLKLQGEIGIDMPYSTKSAFSNSNNQLNPIEDSEKTKILICTACFYDNPHCYGKMMFEDFFECLKFLGEISNQTNYEWYIKPHPDYLPGTLENIEKIKRYFKKLTLINPTTSFYNLTNKIDFVITPYGSVGHELPFLGIPVINCSNINPHQDFNFSFTPNNRNDLKDIILNINSVKIKNRADIYKFYYINNKFFNSSNLFSNDEIAKLNLNKIGTKEMYNFFKKYIRDAKLSKKIEIFLLEDKFKTADEFFFNKLENVDNLNFK